ncbi:MAG: ABC-three component system protein [Alphaproteobacteria bacterium]
MTPQEKAYAIKIFQNKIYESDGSEFEKIFTKIMNYRDSDFQQLKPWGNIGDRKNDGCNTKTATYYQVYAPEDITKSYPEAINKLETDFDGLKKYWSPIENFFFVVNDKYKGVNADGLIKIGIIKTTNNLKECSFLTAKDLGNMVFNDLTEEQMLDVVGYLPDPSKMHILNNSILDEVINHIAQIPVKTILDDKLIAPDWNKKIKINNISLDVKNLLDNAYSAIGQIDKFFEERESILAEETKKTLSDIYQQNKLKFENEMIDKNNIGDNIFFGILENICPKSNNVYQPAAIQIMAKYFESCDIFEEPEE